MEEPIEKSIPTKDDYSLVNYFLEDFLTIYGIDRIEDFSETLQAWLDNDNNTDKTFIDSVTNKDAFGKFEKFHLYKCSEYLTNIIFRTNDLSAKDLERKCKFLICLTLNEDLEIISIRQNLSKFLPIFDDTDVIALLPTPKKCFDKISALIKKKGLGKEILDAWLSFKHYPTIESIFAPSVINLLKNEHYLNLANEKALNHQLDDLRNALFKEKLESNLSTIFFEKTKRKPPPVKSLPEEIQKTTSIKISPRGGPERLE